MIMLKKPLLYAATLLALTFACVDSKHPLSEVEHSQPVEELVGLWLNQAGPAVEYVHVGQAGGAFPAGLMRVIICRHEENSVLQRPGRLFMFATILNGEHFLNIAAIKEENFECIEKKGWKAELIEGYLLAKYQLQGDELLVWPLNPDSKLELIASGKIAGTVDKEKNVSLITAPTAELIKLFTSAEGKELFVKEPIRYKKVAGQ